MGLVRDNAVSIKGSLLGRTPICSSSIIGIQEDPNRITIIPYSHHYWVAGGPKSETLSSVPQAPSPNHLLLLDGLGPRPGLWTSIAHGYCNLLVLSRE